jgi:hypothetical protein
MGSYATKIPGLDFQLSTLSFMAKKWTWTWMDAHTSHCLPILYLHLLPFFHTNLFPISHRHLFICILAFMCVFVAGSFTVPHSHHLLFELTGQTPSPHPPHFSSYVEAKSCAKTNVGCSCIGFPVFCKHLSLSSLFRSSSKPGSPGSTTVCPNHSQNMSSVSLF